MSYYKLDSEYFQKLGKDNKEKYATAKPCPHIYFDNVFPEEVLNDILSEFPNSKAIDWQEFKNKNEVKLASNNEELFGDVTRHFIHILNSNTFISFLEELTGIPNLVPDSRLEGGGLHQILRGGLLRVHADFNKSSRTNLDRRLNVLIYLNKNWKEEYGGQFELWDTDMTKAEVKILPIFNRMAIFSTTSTSYHGHPNPLNCPEDMSRKSIAMYYYTNGRPEEEIIETLGTHSTIFKDREEDKKRDAAVGFKNRLKDFIPPIIIKAIRKLK